MRLSTKNGFLAGILLCVMLLMAATGYFSGSRLSGILAYITGPAWDTADGAMETTIGIQAEMGWMQSRLLGMPVTDSQLAKATEMTDTAFARLLAAKIMDKNTSDKVAIELKIYRAAFAQLRANYDAMQALQRQLHANIEPMMRLGSAMEELGDEQFEALDAEQTISVSSFKKRWSAADGGMESLIGFYTQLYDLEQLIHTADYAALPDKINQALEFQEHAVQAMVDSGVFNQPIAGIISESAAARYADYFAQHKTLMSQTIASALAFRQQFKQCDQASSVLLASLDEFEEMGDSAVEGQASQVADIIRLAQYSTIFMLLLVSLTVAGNYFMLKLWVLVPLNKLHSRIHDLVRGEGDLTARIEHLHQDELGDLGRSINQLMVLLHSLVVKINDKGQAIVEKIAFNKSVAVSTFNHTKNVAENAQNLAAASGQVFVAAGAIASACASASTSVSHARANTYTSRDTTADTAKGMDKVCRLVNELSQRITQLRDSAETIGEIVSVIGGISEQTNLLALNAAIEAARAGEQGRGFAVVADEVRTLASRTSQSTVQITEVIRAIQGMSQSAFELINTCTQEVNSKAQDSQSVCTCLEDLAHVVDDLSGLIEQAASAAEEQAAVTKDMSQRVQVIANDAEGVDSEARASMSCADELNHLARQLNQELARFRV
ncbi:MAG: methyl-accepting chemotaxis protein [Marinagarivorans sp.]